ncbi:ANR family transcriptional regulator [Enterobacter ludwigii]|uniref:ANR family transcriptional regulator n=1 Tax=Enterobacter ludwigii TaxID=299767 RepID=UPI001BD496E3|nr:ANR family transcriptional regulator [Enterobacter hormaechei]
MTMTTRSANTFAAPAGEAASLIWTHSVRLLFLALSQRAATLERTGEYYQASELWGECSALATTSVERFWCEVRQTRCLKQVSGAHTASRRVHTG